MTQCNKCGESIAWLRGTGGFIPTNMNGSSHFNTCIKRKRYKDTSIDYTSSMFEDIVMNKDQRRLGDY